MGVALPLPADHCRDILNSDSGIVWATLLDLGNSPPQFRDRWSNKLEKTPVQAARTNHASAFPIGCPHLYLLAVISSI